MALLLALSQKLAQGFSAFWERYPRREAKKDATKAWNTVVKDDPVIEEQIHKALDWQIPMLLERDPKYRPLPATWIRGERWTDEPPTPAQPETRTRNLNTELPDWKRKALGLQWKKDE